MYEGGLQILKDDVLLTLYLGIINASCHSNLKTEKKAVKKSQLETLLESNFSLRKK